MAEATIHTRLASLVQAAESLNRVSDSLNTTLDAVEKQLNAAHIGLEVWLSKGLATVLSNTSLEPRNEPIHGRIDRALCRELGFTKIHGKWCLAVRGTEHSSGYYQGNADCWGTDSHVVEQPIPLTQATREERIAALEILPELLEALEHRAVKATQTIEEATKVYYKE
jgi:hypothetical protein